MKSFNNKKYSLFKSYNFPVFCQAKLASLVKLRKGIRAYSLIQTPPWLVINQTSKRLDPAHSWLDIEDNKPFNDQTVLDHFNTELVVFQIPTVFAI